MGLLIFDRKCETLSISGNKTEAVGFVKTTVQCLKMVSKREQFTSKQRLFGSDGLCSEKLGIKLSPHKASEIYLFKENTEEQEDTEPSRRCESEKIG